MPLSPNVSLRALPWPVPGRMDEPARQRDLNRQHLLDAAADGTGELLRYPHAHASGALPCPDRPWLQLRACGECGERLVTLQHKSNRNEASIIGAGREPGVSCDPLEPNSVCFKR